MRRLMVLALAAPFLVVPFAAPASAACARVPGDFNGDGYGDLAVGAPYTLEPVEQVPRQGAVHVAYGSAAGVGQGSTGSASFNGRSPGLPDGRFRGTARLGESLASGYFNDDCFADLAASSASSSQLLVMYGTARGLSTSGSQALDRETIQPDGEYGSGISWDLAAGDFNGDGLDDIAAGAPWTDQNSGAVGVLYGSGGGITGDGAQWISQDSPNVPGAAEAGDTFGWTVAAGDFNGDGRADLAAAAPGEALGTATDAGGVIVFPGTTAGLATAGSVWWDQNSAGVPDAPEPQDRFGDALAAGDTNGDQRAELVVGVPTESVGAKVGAGMIQVFRGAAAGLVPALGFTQDDPAIPGNAEGSDYFGAALALSDLNRDGRADLAVGVRYETVDTAAATGAVNILYSNTSGPAAAGAGYLDQNSPGVPGANEDSDAFGGSLSRLANAYGGDALVVAAPDEKLTYASQGAVTVVPGMPTGQARPASHFFSAGNFPGNASEDSNFGYGLP
jgi:hypothetical protein